MFLTAARHVRNETGNRGNRAGGVTGWETGRDLNLKKKDPANLTGIKGIQGIGKPETAYRGIGVSGKERKKLDKATMDSC